MDPAKKVDRDEFYVGYLDKAPKGVGARVKIAVIVLFAGLVLGGATFAWAFRSPGAATWSDEVSEHAGQLIERPYPMLRLADAQGRVQRALLVSAGKHGAAERVSGLDGAEVRVRGTVIARDGRMIIELNGSEDGIAKTGSVAAPVLNPAHTLGRRTLAGEIIDPKCYFGAMKPGDGKLHKSCAIRCISGGIPPMLATRNSEGEISYYLLASSTNGAMNQRVLPFVAEPVEVTGEVEEADGQLILRIDDDAGAIRRRESNP